MFWMKLIKINKILIRFKISRYKMFRLDSALSILSNFTYLIANLLFWYLLTDTGFSIEGWSYDDILVYIAFSELFFGIEGSVFYMVSRFWRIIYTGDLDLQLTRPLDPRLRLIIFNINYMGVLSTLTAFIVILFISRVKLNIFMIFIGVTVVVLANIVLALMRFTLSYTAFWLGKMDAISELTDSMSWFNKYPMVIMPKVIKVVFKTLLPFYYFSTFSSEIVTCKITITEFAYGGLGLLCSLLLWSFINHVVWKKGAARYESING